MKLTDGLVPAFPVVNQGPESDFKFFSDNIDLADFVIETCAIVLPVKQTRNTTTKNWGKIVLLITPFALIPLSATLDGVNIAFMIIYFRRESSCDGEAETIPH
jgi:hypothetical protein